MCGVEDCNQGCGHLATRALAHEQEQGKRGEGSEHAVDVHHEPVWIVGQALHEHLEKRMDCGMPARKGAVVEEDLDLLDRVARIPFANGEGEQENEQCRPVFAKRGAVAKTPDARATGT
jgi:hypothetical protein